MSEATAVDDPWYPEHFWVDPDQQVHYPFRYGDLFRAPSTDAHGRDLVSTGSKKAPWLAVLVFSPSCDLVSKARANSPITVVRVKDLSAAHSSAQPSADVYSREVTNAGGLEHDA